ncbi:response regulator [Eubacterium sp. am_0171]|uniref:response regulator n=1 Tax=Clostridia TaxID=186801 RepID=UPI00102056AD|nr:MULTISPECIES: response regulator [Clostridia]MSC85752.1 response regulator [Eubacterium sp. BIOML-A1]MSD08155.1 response regulator [Eubacterium sp. BIOML-A2]RYT12995.1 response regulator [Eubacterium sp. am_0171]
MLSVLIVDDEPAAIDAMVQIVNWEEINLSVCARAYNGKEGLEKFRELHPDIVLTDVRMPLMDGIEMSRQIKAESPDTMIILVSGYNEFEYVQSALQFGAIEYLLKPTDPDKLHQVLCKAAGQISRKKMWE